jgi:hypothetical protein
MADDIDQLMASEILTPPPDFARRITALVRQIPQNQLPSPRLRLWQWASLGAGACLGALRLCEFVFFAFIAVGAQ